MERPSWSGDSPLERRREIASLDGKSAPQKAGRSHGSGIWRPKLDEGRLQIRPAGGAHRPGTVGTSAAAERKEKPRLLRRTGGAQKANHTRWWLMVNRPYLDEGYVNTGQIAPPGRCYTSRLCCAASAAAAGSILETIARAHSSIFSNASLACGSDMPVALALA